jgi:hypothetical protein
LTYRIDKDSGDHEGSLTLRRRSERWREWTILILAPFFTGLGVFGIAWIFYRSLGDAGSRDGVLPILFGLSIASLSFGVRFGLLRPFVLPDIMRFEHGQEMLLIGSEMTASGVFRVPYKALHAIILARTLFQTRLASVTHKRIRYRVCLLTKSLACWPLFERVGAPKQKRPREQVLGFFRTLQGQIALKKDSKNLGLLDVNDSSVSFLTDETGDSVEIHWCTPFDWRSLWTLGVPSGLLFSLWTLWTRMELNRLWLSFVMAPLVFVSAYLLFRIARSAHKKRVLAFTQGRFRAYFKGSKFPDEVNYPVEGIGAFRFEAPGFGQWAALMLVPKARHESDREHYEKLANEEYALKTQFRPASAKPLRLKWVKSFEARGLGFNELVYLEAWLNERLAEQQAR